MALTNSYATVAQLREHMADPGSKLDAELLERALNATSRSIDKFCGRRFWQDAAVVAREYRPRDETVVFLDDISTETGLVVATDTTGDGSFTTTWLSTDYQLEPRNADVVAAGSSGDAFAWWQITAIDNETFPVHDHRATLRVTAKFGWSAVPVEVEDACLMKAAKLFRRKDSPDGIRGFSEFGPVRISRFEDPDVADLLENYMRISRPDV